MRGMACVVQMISPLLRCHQRSGSSKRDADGEHREQGQKAGSSMAGKEKTLRRNRMKAESALVSGETGDAVLKQSPRSPQVLLEERSGSASRISRCR